MPNPEKILVLVRHGHRDTTSKKADNGLTDTGQKQARRIKEEFADKFEDEKPLFLSSPKHRCIETLEPLADEFDKKVKIDALLDEESQDERASKFIDRIKDFLDWWKNKAPKVTIACSHGDWLPEAVNLLTGKEADFAKGGWTLLTLNAGKVQIQESSANRNN
ncbi:MAG: phosphoglycerate mutase family protein [Bdellovibrionia bacterium]